MILYNVYHTSLLKSGVTREKLCVFHILISPASPLPFFPTRVSHLSLLKFTNPTANLVNFNIRIAILATLQ